MPPPPPPLPGIVPLASIRSTKPSGSHTRPTASAVLVSEKHIWRSRQDACALCRKHNIECVVEFMTSTVVMCQKCRSRGRPAHTCKPSFDQSLCQRYKKRLSQHSYKYTPDGRLRTPDSRSTSPSQYTTAKGIKATVKGAIQYPGSTSSTGGCRVPNHLRSAHRFDESAKQLQMIAMRVQDILKYTKKRSFVRTHAKLIAKACDKELSFIRTDFTDTRPGLDGTDISDSESNGSTDSDSDSNTSSEDDSGSSLSD